MYRGVVTRASASGVWAKIAEIAPGVEFGPLETCSDTILVGQNVLVADLGSESLPDLVVIGTLWPGVAP